MNIRIFSMAALGAALALSSACSEDDVEAAREQLVRTSTPSAADCPNGGSLIETGFDDNGDGELQPDEVDRTETVCSGTPGDRGESGLRSLVRTTAEPEGANCDNGGTKVDVGVDDNADGTLEDGEVDITTYVCRGLDGEDAPALLTRTSSASEAECEFGGVRIETGFDENDDQVLDPAEVDDTQFVCNGEDGTPLLVVIEAIAPGAECAVGGRRVRSGVDENRDGQLALAETLDEAVLCDPVATLVEITELAVGTSTTCTNGGERIDVGLDANGDGVLEASEVNSTTFVCNGTDGNPVLVRRRSEPAGANCEFGGTRLAFGVDLNGNRILETDEEETITYACNGEDGIDGGEGGAVRVSSEPRGENCFRGGTRIETGPDLNGDGVLDDSEVTNTSYACDGQSAVGLVTVTPEPAGANCADGGRRIDSGADTNANGDLDPSEIQTTTYVCSTVAVVPIRIETPSPLTDAIRNTAYAETIEATGGVGGAYTWEFVNPAAVPNGLTIDPSGTPSTTINGAPLATGTFQFQVRVTDFFLNSATATFDLTVTGTPLTITTFSPPRLENGAPYSYQLAAVGGDTANTPATWRVASGTLPAGLSLSTGGLISGTPTTDEGAFVVVEADDGTDTARAGLRIKGEQNYGAYCGDFVVDLQEDISVFEFSAGPTVTSTGTVIDNALIEADCFEDIVFSAAHDVVIFMGNETSGTDELYAVDLSSFPSVGAPIKLNPALPAPGETHDADVLDFKVSPTGDFVAFRADDRSNFEDELFVFDLSNLATASPVRVTTAVSDVGVESEYAWIPGTNQLLYISDELSSGDDALMFYDADTGATPIEVNGPLVQSADVFEFAVSPTGEWAAYVADQDTDFANRIYLVDLRGAAPGLPTEFTGAGVDPAADVATGAGDFGFSPNGDWLHYIVNFSGTGGDELYVRSVLEQAAPPTRLSQDLSNASTLLDVSEVVWAPDGRRVAYRGDVLTSADEELFVADTLVPGSPIKVSPTLASGSDVNSITGNDFAWDPDAEFVVFNADAASSGSDELYVTFLSDPGNPVRVFSAGLQDDALSVKVADDGETLFTVAELNGTSDAEFFLAGIGAGTVQAPMVINDPSPFPGLQDVDDEFELVAGGDGVLYWSDEVTADDDEAIFRPITGGAAGARTVVNPALPASGDVDAVVVEEE